ncbi:hypothetical protein XENOCAPTIV_025516 [Xenoophorus captivus]|uniref:NADH dehydrogenase subunit 4L n=1 Tax=Xenoophorus captivus TaxID=1517983 RepID=A0ABV0S540_9TELE
MLALCNFLLVWRFFVMCLGVTLLSTTPYLLEFNFLCIQLLLLSLQFLSLFLKIYSPLIEVVFLLNQMLLKLPHLFICIRLILLQSLTEKFNETSFLTCMDLT